MKFAIFLFAGKQNEIKMVETDNTQSAQERALTLVREYAKITNFQDACAEIRSENIVETIQNDGLENIEQKTHPIAAPVRANMSNPVLRSLGKIFHSKNTQYRNRFSGKN